MEDAAISYAMENTRVLYAPDRRIDSFGDTRFNFRLLSEPLDEVGTCRVRSGWVETQRPRILRPEPLRGIEMEGFSEGAAEVFDWLKARGVSLKALLQYGFSFGRSEVHEELVHEDMATVCDRVVDEALHSGDALRAVIEGVDDNWEISLLRFILEMIQQSHEINIFDLRRRGLL